MSVIYLKEIIFERLRSGLYFVVRRKELQLTENAPYLYIILIIRSGRYEANAAFIPSCSEVSTEQLEIYHSQSFCVVYNQCAKHCDCCELLH